MADVAKKRHDSRIARKSRTRRRISGTAERPRLCVFRSLKYTYASIVDDSAGVVIASASSKQVVAEGKSQKCVESAKEVGKKLAEAAKAKSVSRVVFDRSGYIYHGRVAAVADGAREGGLDF